MIGEYFDPRKEFGKAVTELAKDDKRIVVLSADSGKSSGFDQFMQLFPDRYYECGIMEQGAVGIAVGLATTGKIPVFCAIAPFVTARPYEMFRNDVGYMNQNVKIVGRNCGISYSDLGSTHHSLEDFAIISMIPDVVVLAPQDATEIKNAVRAMIEHEGPVYMRIGNPKIPDLFDDELFEIGKGRLIQDGSDVALISTGSMTGPAIKATALLEENGVSVRLIGMPTITPIDKNIVLNAAKETNGLVTIEEHYEIGGLGSKITDLLSDVHPTFVKRIGVPHIYASSGPYNELLASYGLDPEGIKNTTLEFIDSLPT